jgi:hypothetical protein
MTSMEVVRAQPGVSAQLRIVDNMTHTATMEQMM